MPRTHTPYFTDINESEIDSFARILKEILMRMKVALKDPPYNFIIHTTPSKATVTSRNIIIGM